MTDARAIAEETARASYGRLLAWLSSRTRDVAAAEDALADAFKSALETWPDRGTPDAPEAWLLTAARRKLIDQYRREQTRHNNVGALALAAKELEASMREDTPFPDERLKLMFICAHPAIDRAIRTPLMLQTVLGLDAAQVASAFLVSPSAMSGRLVRAKRKIKTAGISFEPPAADQLEPRLSAVLEAIYAAFGADWDDQSGADATPANLATEALYLGRLISELMPGQAEAWGLCALMLFVEARRNCRNIDGEYTPLTEQDSNLWDLKMIEAAESALERAWSLHQNGPYQLEAAIQSAHIAGRLQNRDTSGDIALLYKRLVDIAPTIGAEVGYAAALATDGNARKALETLDAIDQRRIDTYQPYWAVRAHIYSILGKLKEARGAYDRAIGLTEDAATRSFLAKQKAERT